MELLDKGKFGEKKSCHVRLADVCVCMLSLNAPALWNREYSRSSGIGNGLLLSVAFSDNTFRPLDYWPSTVNKPSIFPPSLLLSSQLSIAGKAMHISQNRHSVAYK